MSVEAARQDIFKELGRDWEKNDDFVLGCLLTDHSLTTAIQKAYKNADLSTLYLHEVRLIKLANEIESSGSLFITSMVAILALGFFAAFTGLEIAHDHLLSAIFSSTGAALALTSMALYKWLYKAECKIQEEAEFEIKRKKDPTLTKKREISDHFGKNYQNLDKEEVESQVDDILATAIEKAYENDPLHSLTPFELNLISAAKNVKAQEIFYLIGFSALIALASFGELIGAELTNDHLLSIIFGSIGGGFSLIGLAIHQLVYKRLKEKQYKADKERLNKLNTTHLCEERTLISKRLGSQSEDLAERILRRGLASRIQKAYSNVDHSLLSEYELMLVDSANQILASRDLKLTIFIAAIALSFLGATIASHFLHQELHSIVFGAIGGALSLTSLSYYYFFYRKDKKEIEEAQSEFGRRLNQELVRMRAKTPVLSDENVPMFSSAWIEIHKNKADHAVNRNYVLLWIAAVALTSTLFCGLYDPSLSDLIPGPAIALLCGSIMVWNYFANILPARKYSIQLKDELHPRSASSPTSA